MSIDDDIAAERRLLAARLRELSDAEWRTPSLCEGWDIERVVAHVVTPFLVSRAGLAARMVRGRGPSGAMDLAARELAASRERAELVDVLEANADTRFRAPALPASAPLTDVVVHSADIRWALGDPETDWADPARLHPALTFLASRRAAAGFVPPRRLSGLRLVANHQQWSHGSGLVVEGPSLALAMAMLGRPRALPHLSGPGVPILAAAIT